MLIPKPYDYLNTEPGPPQLLEAIKLYGIKERAGDLDNPIILEWAKELGIADIYNHDSIPWCGLFMAYTLHKSSFEVLKSYHNLRAKDWAAYGSPVKEAMLGDILVFERPGGGHVGYYVAEDDTAYHVLGGNEGDMVKIIRILKSRCIAVRRPKYNVIPNNLRKIMINNNGEISKNES